MLQVVFHNLKKSDFVRDIVAKEVESVLEKFPQMQGARTSLIVSMDNSPQNAGADQFTVKLVTTMKGIKPIIISKSAGNLYQASALLADRLLDVVHRQFEKKRDSRRSDYRRLKEWTHSEAWQSTNEVA